MTVVQKLRFILGVVVVVLGCLCLLAAAAWAVRWLLVGLYWTAWGILNILHGGIP